jgi:hypothetical protein
MSGKQIAFCILVIAKAAAYLPISGKQKLSADK